MLKKQQIVLIGAGNVATHLGIAFRNAGHRIVQIYSPGGRSAADLGKKLKAGSISDLKKLNKEADLYVIAVKDDAVEEVAKMIKLKDQLLVHTSGSVKMNVLKGCSKNFGVLYPLQTFSKDKAVKFKEVPVCIEGNNTSAISTLNAFARGISKKVLEIDSAQRKAIHLSAVFACNFSNHMYQIAENILASDKIPFDILHPLILETAQKALSSSPSKVQTGPAARGDHQTMKEHLKLLKKDKELRKLYTLISEHIAK